MIWVARLNEGYTNHIMWLSHHKTPEGAVNAVTEHNGRPVEWVEDWAEYVDIGYRGEVYNHGDDNYDIISYDLHL